MSIEQITTSVTGLTGVSPRIVYILTNDTIATVTTAGYLNHAVNEGISFLPGDLAIVGTTSTGLLKDTVSNWYQVTHSGLNWSLIPQTDNIPGNLVVGGSIIASGDITANTGNFIAGAGHNLTLYSPGGVATGNFVLAGSNNAGAFTVGVTNLSFGQNTTISIPDPGNAAARFLVGATNTPFTANHSLVANGTSGLIADAGYQLKTVAQAAVAGGAAAQVVVDAFCTAASMVTASWNDTTNAVTIQKVAAGVGQFTVTSSADPGASHLNYIITKV